MGTRLLTCGRPASHPSFAQVSPKREVLSSQNAMNRKNPGRALRGRWGLTAACGSHRQPASASPARPCRQLRGRPGQPHQILAMVVKAQVTAASASCPRPGGPGVGEPGGRRVPGQVSPSRTRARASTRAPCAHHRRMWTAAGPGSDAPGRRPGRRLIPAAQSAKSPGTPPGDDDLDAAAARPARGGGRQPALPAGQQPARGALATGHGGHAAHRPGERQGLPPARQHHGHRPRTWLDRSVAGAQPCLR